MVSSSRRCSTPCARRSSQPARRFSAPVRSRPAPRIIVAITLMTALLEKPLNRSSGATRPVSPSSISTTSATTSARIRSNRNIAIVKPTSPSTSFMSVVSVSAVSMRLRRILVAASAAVVKQVPHAVPELLAARLEMRLRAPRAAAGHGPRGPARLRRPGVASSTSHICSA